MGLEKSSDIEYIQWDVQMVLICVKFGLLQIDFSHWLQGYLNGPVQSPMKYLIICIKASHESRAIDKSQKTVCISYGTYIQYIMKYGHRQIPTGRASSVMKLALLTPTCRVVIPKGNSSSEQVSREMDSNWP